MPVRYLHFIDQGGLHCHLVRQRKVEHLASFHANEEGIAEFDRWLRESREGLHTLLADVAEEGFHVENIPAVMGSDRKALISRKLTQHFFGSPYAAALSLGREKSGRRDERLLLTAITRPTLVEPWMGALRHAEAAIVALYTVPLLTERLVRQVFPDAARGLILLLSDSGIRQIYFEDGRLRFSRLAVAPEGPFSRWGADCVREAQKTYQYLSAQRWLPRGTQLPVRIVVSAHDAGQVSEDVSGATQAVDNLVFQTSPLEALAQHVGLHLPHAHSDSRGVIMQLALLANTGTQLAPATERRFYRLWQARFGILVAGLVVVVASTVLSLKWGLDARMEQMEAESLRSEAHLQASRYKQLLATLPPMPASLEALRTTVDAIDQLSARVVDPRPALFHLSKALDAFPDVSLDRLEWRDENWSEDGRSAIAPGNTPAHDVLIINASLDTAGATDPRAAILRVQSFANNLRDQSGGEVLLLQQPFDTESSKTLRSDAENASKRPAFRLQLGLGSKP